MSDRIAEITEKAAQGGLFLFSGNFFSTLILAVGAIIVARLLGPPTYSLYAPFLAIEIVIPQLPLWKQPSVASSDITIWAFDSISNRV